ncbi:MAG: hypothetical protein AAGU27_12950 [Dehalobacterium sp.]
MFRRRRRHMQAMSKQPQSRRTRASENETIVVENQDQPTQMESIIFWLKNANLGDITRQFSAITEHMGPERIADFMKQFNDLVISSMLKDESKFNEETVNKLLQGILAVFEANDLPKEEKSELFDVETDEETDIETDGEKQND